MGNSSFRGLKMLDQIAEVGYAAAFVGRDVLDLLSSSPQLQAGFVKELADNFVVRVMHWPAGLIPRNYTEHGITEMLIEEGLALSTLPLTGPVCLPALATSFILGKILPEKK